MSPIDEVWAALRAENRPEPGWHLRRIHTEAPCEILAGIHQPDRVPGLIFEVDASAFPSGIRVPQSSGFRVDTSLIGHSHTGRVRIALSLAQAAYATVFSVLCSDTAGCAAAQTDERAALTSAIGRLHVWQAFMAKHGPDGLSENAVIGLMGELHILVEHVVPVLGVGDALSSWAGPRGEPNDFSFPGGYLEVKATARQAPNALTISNADQLDVARGKILLAHVRFRPSPEGLTLPGIVAKIRSWLASEAPAAIPEFASLLLAAGYVEAHQENYTLRLVPEGLQLFEVGDDFPHIRRSELRPGVLDCTYPVDLGACARWAAPPVALSSLIRPVS
ncbi:PD-(D/E)XK motif protein [Mesorhizobium sp. M1406]|uniref:PD-(D/E)XK motif protein n=1 Tax=Mesorhizobium sp. M1406 TaxID=2957099 RepID=UPI003339F85D